MIVVNYGWLMVGNQRCCGYTTCGGNILRMTPFLFLDLQRAWSMARDMAGLKANPDHNAHPGRTQASLKAWWWPQTTETLAAGRLQWCKQRFKLKNSRQYLGALLIRWMIGMMDYIRIWWGKPLTHGELPRMIGILGKQHISGGIYYYLVPLLHTRYIHTCNL